jgi:hypothetical protein
LSAWYPIFAEFGHFRLKSAAGETGLSAFFRIFKSQPEWFWGGLALLWIGFKAIPEFQLDEDRFVFYADNLIQGFYAPPESKWIWNGPGLPLILVPFRYFDWPLLPAKFLNAIALWGALRLFRLALAQHGENHVTTLWAWGFGGYVFLFGFSWLHLVMTETLALLCVSCLLYAWTRLSQGCLGREAWKWKCLGGFAVGYLSLTRFFFGYVMVLGCLAALISGMLGLWLRKTHPRKASSFSNAAKALAWTQGMGLAICLPYLVYTYQLTGKVFYWGNTGGSQLYTLTLPEPHLLGDVIPMEQVQIHPAISPSAYALLNTMNSMDYVQQDIAFRKAAMENIRQHPKKAFQNWRANCTRLVFDFPFSHFPTSHSKLRTGNLSFLFAFWFYFACVSFCYGSFRWRQIGPSSWLALGFFGVSIAALSLVSGYARFVFPLLPMLGIVLADLWRREPRIP